MSQYLKNLDAYTCASKLYGSPMKGYDSTVEGDLTRLKKGIRANNDLNWHEAFYFALEQFGLLEVVQRLCKDGFNPKLGLYDYKKERKFYLEQSNEYYQKAQTASSRKGGFSEQDYLKYAEQYKYYAELCKILDEVKDQAKIFYDGLKVNRSKLVDWKDLTSVQFYKYNAATNSFIEFDHRK